MKSGMKSGTELMIINKKRTKRREKRRRKSRRELESVSKNLEEIVNHKRSSPACEHLEAANKKPKSVVLISGIHLQNDRLLKQL